MTAANQNTLPNWPSKVRNTNILLCLSLDPPNFFYSVQESVQRISTVYSEVRITEISEQLSKVDQSD